MVKGLVQGDISPFLVLCSSAASTAVALAASKRGEEEEGGWGELGVIRSPLLLLYENASREEWKERPRVGGAGEPNPCSISSQVPPSPFVTTLSSELTTISSSSRPTRRSSLISSTAGNLLFPLHSLYG
ncbi:hypothetical protein BHE74_00001717 [Ensete ventricosum]|nr:hypothetical protein BHE74_00001717 [Ensete ventricosum]